MDFILAVIISAVLWVAIIAFMEVLRRMRK